MFYDIEALRNRVREKLSEARYRHCVAVQKRAIHLAKLYGADWYKAGLAGLLHDICHDMSYDEQLNYIRSCGILLDILTLQNPPVWHAIAGAHYIEDALGVKDEDVIAAVRWHTTGRRAMTTLEKVVYIADLTSEDRAFPDIGTVRALSEKSLDEAVRYSLCYTVEKLVRRKKPLVQDGWEAYNYYLLDGRDEESMDDIL